MGCGEDAAGSVVGPWMRQQEGAHQMATVPEYTEGIDPERALKYAVQRVRGNRAEIIEGIV